MRDPLRDADALLSCGAATEHEVLSRIAALKTHR